VIDTSVRKVEDNPFQKVFSNLNKSSSEVYKAYSESEEGSKKEIFLGWCTTALEMILTQVEEPSDKVDVVMKALREVFNMGSIQQPQEEKEEMKV
jgi:hypothetical protein